MTAYDDWLEKPYDDQDKIDQAIDDEIDHLMRTEFNPNNVDVFLNSIDNACLYAIKKSIEKTLQDNAPFEELGRLIFEAVQTHWIDSAMQQAQTNINEKRK